MKIDKALALVGLLIALAGIALLIVGKIRFGADFSLQPPLLILLLIAVGACLRTLLGTRRKAR